MKHMKRAKRRSRKNPQNALAWCMYHGKAMNGAYIDQKGCATNNCRHIHWFRSNR